MIDSYNLWKLLDSSDELRKTKLTLNGHTRIAADWADVKNYLEFSLGIDRDSAREILTEYLENDHGFFFAGYLVNRKLGEERRRT